MKTQMSHSNAGPSPKKENGRAEEPPNAHKDFAFEEWPFKNPLDSTVGPIRAQVSSFLNDWSSKNPALVHYKGYLFQHRP